MPIALIAALFFTVALLVVTAYFIMGSLPLLILKHDTPMDARFIRAFFNVNYLAAMGAASATALCFAWAARPLLAGGAAGLALLAYGLRRTLLPRMEALRQQIQASSEGAIGRFRRAHAAAIAINLAQLVLVLGSLIHLSMQLR